MEEQMEIKVSCHCWVKKHPEGFAVFSIYSANVTSVFAETADREQTAEAEDRHTRESECNSVQPEAAVRSSTLH